VTARNFVNKYNGFGGNLFLHLKVKIYLFCLRLKAAIVCESLVLVYQKHVVTTQYMYINIYIYIYIFIFAVTNLRTSTSHRPVQKHTTVAGLNMFL